MACNEEARKRKTYENIRRLADRCRRLTGDSYIIYREASGTFNFCRAKDYTPARGTTVEILQEP